jgi:hypothetical protein
VKTGFVCAYMRGNKEFSTFNLTEELGSDFVKRHKLILNEEGFYVGEPDKDGLRLEVRVNVEKENGN